MFRIVRVAALRGFGAVSLLLMTFVVTRTLSVQESGKFLYLLSAVIVLAPIMVFGTNFPSLRLIAIHNGRQQLAQLMGVIVCGFGLLAVAWAASVALFSVIALLGWMPMQSSNNWLTASAPLVALVGLNTSFTILIAHQLQGLSYPTHSIIALSIVNPVVFALIMGFIPDQFEQAGDALNLLALSSAAALCYAVVILVRHVQWRRPEAVAFRLFLRSCWPIWIVAICTALTNWGAQLVSVFYVSPETIALLNVSQRVAMSVSLLLIAVNLVISPRIAQLHSDQRTSELQELVGRAVTGVTLASLPVVFVICFFPEFVLSFFGNSYVAAAPFLIIFGVSQFINVATGPSVQLLTMSGFERVVMKIAVCSCVLTLLCALILLQLFGAIGVPIAAGMGIVTQNVTSAIMARRLTSVNIFAAPVSLLRASKADSDD